MRSASRFKRLDFKMSILHRFTDSHVDLIENIRTLSTRQSQHAGEEDVMISIM